MEQSRAGIGIDLQAACVPPLADDADINDDEIKVLVDKQLDNDSSVTAENYSERRKALESMVCSLIWVKAVKKFVMDGLSDEGVSDEAVIANLKEVYEHNTGESCEYNPDELKEALQIAKGVILERNNQMQEPDEVPTVVGGV